MKINTKNDSIKSLHPRNKHNNRYDFKSLIETLPELNKFVSQNKFGHESVDFANPEAVRSLNKALLKLFYKISYYELPATNLYPPIPGRADYIHYVADVLSESRGGEIPTGSQVKILDIGTGANCIYPIIGHQEYNWSFVGTDIDKPAIETARNIIKNNSGLENAISIRLQEKKRNILKGVITTSDQFDFVICNPPFHNSREEATNGTKRKLRNLGIENDLKPILNFGGQNNELWCEGGEKAFITNMIYESVHFKSQCHFFSSLVSKKDNLKSFYNILNKLKATYRIIEMEQGNKTSRILIWNY